MMNRLNKFISLIALFALLFVAFIKPVAKYFEFVHQGVRINSAMVVLLIVCTFLVIYFIRYLGYNSKFKTTYYFNKLYPLFVGIAIFLLLYCTLISLINTPIIGNNVGALNYLIRFSDSIIKYWLFTFLGFYVLDIFAKKRLVKYILISWWCFFCVVFYFSITNISGFKLFLDDNAIYLSLADSFSILSIFLLTTIQSAWKKTTYLLLSIVLLFLLMSRAALFFFIMAYGLVYLKRHRQMILMGLVSLIFFCWYFDVITLVQENASNRMFRFFVSGQDSSLNKRAFIMREGLKGLKENWLFGQYMGDYLQHHSMSRYIHNYLSFWRQFGLFPFLIFASTIAYLYIKVVLNYFFSPKNKMLEFLFVYTTVFLFHIIFARSFLSAYIWISLTAIPIYFYTNKYESSKSCYRSDAGKK